VKHLFFSFILLLKLSTTIHAQDAYNLIFPDGDSWTSVQEGKIVEFQVRTTSPQTFKGFAIEKPEELDIQFDSLGHFYWKLGFDLVSRIELKKEFTIIFKGYWEENKRVSKSINFTIEHTNRAPVVEEIPAFYVKQASRNTYQISNDYVFDPDGDPVVFKIATSQMPEGMILSSQGIITWTPSRSQFNNLKTTPITLDFVVQDQPDKAETKGKLRIAQTQLDLPPEILVVPSDTVLFLKENETINLKIYVSDPNGDDNIRNTGFISSDVRLKANLLKENTPLQYEFIWSPGYDFVNESEKKNTVMLTLFVVDKSNNRVQRNISIQVLDTENIIEKDNHQYQKYVNNLESALILIKQLDLNLKTLNSDYKKSKKGKKRRAVIIASLGAITGFSPLLFNPEQSQIVAGIGGTTVLTLSTLEATSKSKDEILEKIKINIDIRNKIQSYSDEFARKNALKSSRRTIEFEKEIEKLRIAINDQRLVLLELDAYQNAPEKFSGKDLKKAFPDFNEEN
jgi:hypothetical protein